MLRPVVHAVIGLALLGGAWCTRQGPAARHPDPVGLILPIPDRGHAPGAPRAGWCGESVIQQAALYYGTFLSQRDIHRAGHSTHPDLYASDIPRALKKVGLSFERWRAGPRRYVAFLTWIRSHLRRGHPVLAGMKIYPTAHPRWGLDHFVLVVGFQGSSLLVNTTWRRQQWLDRKQLRQQRQGLSFANRYDVHWALALTGWKDQQGPPLAARRSATHGRAR